VAAFVERLGLERGLPLARFEEKGWQQSSSGRIETS
jgi:hypothetical protein